ncbi:MAG: glycosyltransferase family 39 protein, partial [Candidatus Hydrogenedentota bacterium]
MKSKNVYIDCLLILILVLLCIMYNYNFIFYGNTVAEIHLFHLISYRVNDVLFPFKNSLAINPELKNTALCPANVIFLPPGMHIITKLVSSYISRSHTTMNIILLIIRIIETILIFLILKKITKRVAAFSFTLFMISLYSIYFLNDSFVQPLLILTCFLLVLDINSVSLMRYFFCGLVTGLTWIFRQNVGLFLTSSIIAFIFLSHLENTENPSKKDRITLIAFLFAVMVCGVIALKTMRYVDDEIWYFLPFFILFISLYIFSVKNKNLYINLKSAIKDLSIFIIPNISIILLWILYFGAVIGFDEYLYNIFLVPFKHRTLYEYSFLFHIKRGVEHLVGFISNLNLAEIYGF